MEMENGLIEELYAYIRDMENLIKQPGVSNGDKVAGLQLLVDNIDFYECVRHCSHLIGDILNIASPDEARVIRQKYSEITGCQYPK